MDTVAHPLKRGHRTLRLPISKADDDRFMADKAFAKAHLDELYGRYPELFPEEFERGYALYGLTEPSCKQQ